MKIVPDLQYGEGPLPESLRDDLIEGEVDPFGIDSAGLTFVSKDHFVIAFNGERPVATAGWLAREVRIDGRAIAAAGLGGVLVRRSCRGRGLSRLVSTAAMSSARESARTHGILLCRAQVQPLWARLGWTTITAPATYIDPDGKRRIWPLVAMARPLTGEPWPKGDVDLGGPPF